MSIRDLTTRVRDEFFPRTSDPIHSFQREMNRLFQNSLRLHHSGEETPAYSPKLM